MKKLDLTGWAARSKPGLLVTRRGPRIYEGAHVLDWSSSSPSCFTGKSLGDTTPTRHGNRIHCKEAGGGA